MAGVLVSRVPLFSGFSRQAKRKTDLGETNLEVLQGFPVVAGAQQGILERRNPRKTETLQMARTGRYRLQVYLNESQSN